MNKPIDSQTLSQYYDGLLSPEESARIEAALEQNPDLKKTLDSYHMFDQALSPNLEDAGIDRLLSNTIQEVHQKLARPARREATLFDWVFAPRTLATTCILLVMMGLGVSTVMNSLDTESTQPSLLSRIMEVVIPEEETPDDTFVSVQHRALQNQALAMIGGYAQSALNEGVRMASEQTDTLSETYRTLESRSKAGPALQAIRSTVSTTAGQPAVLEEEPSSAFRLFQAGMQQVVLGLGATFVTLFTLL